MPKIKTNSGAKKRFSLTGTGKVKSRKPGKRHLLRSKSKSRKRRLEEYTFFTGSVKKQVKRLIPSL